MEMDHEALKALIAEMEEEERRAAREGLSEGELAVFDLLTKPNPKLTKPQEIAVKKVAQDLLAKLQEYLSVDEWRAKPPIRAAVHSTIRFTLNELLEEPYPEPLWKEKVDTVWAFIFARQAARSRKSFEASIGA
jgi:type I restriction enzyme, R subunit